MTTKTRMAGCVAVIGLLIGGIATGQDAGA